MSVLRRSPLVLFVSVGLAASFLMPAWGQTEVAFPDGTWKGTAVFTGSISKQGVFATGSGDVSFTLKVHDGQVSDGVLRMSGSARSRVAGGGRANLKVAGALALGGTASRVTVSGTLSVSGTASAQGFVVPVDLSIPAVGSFSPTAASCSQVAGDLATETRAVQRQYGFSTTVRALFVAVRQAQADAADVVEEYADLVEDMHEALTQAKLGPPPTIDQLRQLASRAAGLQNAIAGLKSCGDPPEGFEQGLANPLFSDLFRRILLLMLEDADQLSVTQLISLAYLGYEVGAVGTPSPDPQAALEAEDELVLALNAKLDFAVEDGDTDAILAIYTAAQQLAIDDLAAKAKSALGGFIEEGGVGDQDA